MTLINVIITRNIIWCTIKICTKKFGPIFCTRNLFWFAAQYQAARGPWVGNRCSRTFVLPSKITQRVVRAHTKIHNLTRSAYAAVYRCYILYLYIGRIIEHLKGRSVRFHPPQCRSLNGLRIDAVRTLRATFSWPVYCSFIEQYSCCVYKIYLYRYVVSIERPNRNLYYLSSFYPSNSFANPLQQTNERSVSSRKILKPKHYPIVKLLNVGFFFLYYFGFPPLHA